MTFRTLVVGLGDRSYPIHIGDGLLDRADLLAPHVGGRRAVVVTNATLAPLYADRLERTLAAAGATAGRIVIPDGEAHKTWPTLDAVFGQLLEMRADRKSVVVALGGGVVGDLAGFAAASYQRGIDFVQVPTTLLALVDSSVGGKTGINHPLGKNMIGAFHQPLAVLADTGTLASLPDREYRSGLAEVVKYGVIHDAAFFEWLEKHLDALLARDPAALIHAIHRSCEVKAEIVALDERESGLRALLNLGHTFGHAIETVQGYGEWLHGEAVAAGMAMAARFSVRLGRLDEADAARLEAFLVRAQLPTAPPRMEPGAWLEAMGRDKKNESGRITLILLDAIGRARIEKATPAGELEAFLAAD
ncbi:MAG: 3-dehydroquinate synthase [Betaproteobacteria bacterium]|nr:3-dehydroquinate synthase [Betaproteobacteria bacterium]